MRVVIQQLAIFLLPILLYAGYLYWRRVRARAAGEPEPPWAHGHWYWAVVAGLVLSIALFVAIDVFIDNDPATPYRPPTWQR